MFLARVEWLPVTSRSHGHHITDVTDKCKISIMIVHCRFVDYVGFALIFLKAIPTEQPAWNNLHLIKSCFFCGFSR